MLSTRGCCGAAFQVLGQFTVRLHPLPRRYTFLQTQGDDSIANAQTKIRAAVQSQSTIVNTIVALHVLLLVGTITAGIRCASSASSVLSGHPSGAGRRNWARRCQRGPWPPPPLSRSYTIFLLRPLQRLLGVEALRLSHLMAELPKELAIEEAVVALVEEMVSSTNEENLMDLAESRDQDSNEKKDEKVKALATNVLCMGQCLGILLAFLSLTENELSICLFCRLERDKLMMARRAAASEQVMRVAKL